MGNIKDYDAARVSEETYNNAVETVEIKRGTGEMSYWKTIETIKDKDTGLQGYVLQNPETEEVVVSFRGTELPRMVEKQVPQGSPS
ncbi:hypothetical protein GLV94_02605 [Virgibacillus halodenitrificans]|uniref:DUF3892 domain-containing protein n=1 Tax=Virgibacillus halodenitrificans TaxID=1482 RepID=A0ABR7VKE0_VIRHA|nr:hypothetical protein [Virgibacillus halodenitrificans]MBD1222384.1 hypothetical protein [Virgibacillus halodenitrificans]MYL44524.1 hypothetical protein [Virgibacillus halodenitrificans]